MPNILVNNSSKKKKKTSAESSASTTAKNNPYIEGSKRRAVQDAMNNYDANRRKAEQVAADRNSMMSLYSMHTAPTQSRYDYAKRKLNTAANNYYNGYDDNLFHPNAKKALESTQKLYTDAKNRKELDDFTKQFETYTKKEQEKNNFRNMTYEDLRKTIDSGYLSSEQSKWAEDIIRTKANSEQATDRANYLNEQAARLEQDLYDRYGGTPAYFGIHEQDMYSRQQKQINNLRQMAEQYAGQAWIAEGLENGEEAVRSATYEKDYMMVPNRAYNEQYSGIFGLISDDEIQTKEGIAGARARAVMTDEEKLKYSALYNTQGPDAAKRYFDSLTYDLDERLQNRKTESVTSKMDDIRNADNLVPNVGIKWLDDYIEKTAKQSLEGSAFVNARLNNLASGIGALDATFQRLTNTGGQPVNWNTASFTPHTVSQAIQESQLSQIQSTYNPQLESLGKFAYQTGGSMIDSLGIVGASMLGIPGATAILGMSAATDSMLKAKERGATDGQAVSVGILSGVAETLFEEVSLEKLLTAGTPATISEAIKNIFLRQGVTEASEEVATTVANTITDAMIMGDKSELKANIQRYVDMGYSQSDAERLGGIDWLKDLFMDALGGFVSGAMFGAGQQSFSYANYMSGLQNVSNATTTTEAIERMSDMVPTLLDENGQITDSRSAADRLQKTYEETMGRLSKNSVEAEEAIYANNVVIDEAVKQGQLTKEEGEQAKQITRMLVEQQEAATQETVKQQSRTEQKNRDILKKLSDQSDAKISTTQAIMDNYNGKSLPTEYFGAWRYYEQSGMQAKANGEKNTFNAMFMNDTRYDGVISRAAAQTAYAAGFTMPQSDRVTRQIKEMGEGIFKASAKALEELAKHVDNVDATVSFLTAVAQRSGLNIDLDEALKGKANGQFFAAVMTMAISPDANIVSTVFHEGGHAIERYDPKSYAQLKADMLDWYAQTKGMKDVDAMAASYADTYKGYSRSEIETEMVNDAFGSLFNADDAAKDLANWMAENKTEAEQKTFKEKLSELIDRVIKWMKSLVTLKGTNPMQRRTAEMQAKQAQEFRKAFLSALDTAVAKAKSTGEFSVDTTATRYDSVASARSMIDYSMNLATFNYADKYVQMDDEKRKQLSLLKDALIEVRGIEVEIKKIEKRGLHNIHQINETLAAHPEIHQKLVDVQDRLNRAGISCNFVSQVGEEVRVEGRRVAPGMLGLPIEYVDAEKGARFIGERTSEDEVRHAGYKFAAFKRAIPQMLLDSIRVDVRESLRAELIKAVEDAYKRRDTSEILDDYSKAFPITLEELNEVLGVNVDREAIHAGLNKGLDGVQAALKYADKTLLALNTNAACPMFTIGNHGCYLDSCYVTQMGSGMMGTNLFTTAWYAGELLQLNQDTIDKMNKTGGLRINGAGDTTMDNVSQLVDVLKHAAMRGLKIKIITKQLTTFDLLSKAKKAGVNLKGVTVQPSMDNIWIPADLDNVYGSGFRGNTQMSKTFEKAIALRDAGKTAEAESLFENLQVVYDDVFGRATRIAPMVDDKGNPVLDADGNPVNTLYRKYGFSTEQVNDMITRAKKEYPEVTVTPRYVVCTPQEIAEIALNKHGLIVNGGAIIQTLMHGKVPKGCFSDYGTELLNFNALRHVVERKNGVWDFYGELVGYETKTDTDENGNIIYDKKGKPKKVDVRDENGNFVVRRVRPKPSKTSPYEKVKAWVNGVLDDGTPRYTEEEKNIIWLTLKESMCCQASDSKDACAGCASLCANGAYVASIQSRQEAYLKQVQPGEALPDWAEIDDSETTETSDDVVDLSLRVNDYSEFKDQIGDAEWGVNVNDKTQAFTEQILDELKTIETRNSPSLRHLIGQRVGIVRTGKGKAMLVGFVTITGEKVYNSLKEFQDDADAHKVTGGKYGWKDDTEVKYGYTLSDPQWLVDEDGNRVEIPMDGYGVVKRALAPKDVVDCSKAIEEIEEEDPETAIRKYDKLYMLLATNPDGYQGNEEERIKIMDTINRIVAEKRGFTTPKLYHGTFTFGHTKFEHGGSGIFAAFSKRTAKSYAHAEVREIGTTGHYKTSADLLQAFKENADEKAELINRDAQKEIAKKSIAKDEETMERLTSEEMSDMFDENGNLQYIGGPSLVRDRERVREQVSSMFDDLWSNFLDVVICKNELMKAIESGSTDGLDYSIEDLEDTIRQAREASKPEDLVKWVDKYWYGPNMKRQLLKSVISEMADAMERASEIIPIAKNTSGEDMISYHYLYDSDDITLLTLENAKERIDYGGGMYQLYGNPGDKVLVVECNGRHWNELGDLVERSEELQDLYEEEWDKDEDWWSDEDYADWVVTDDITERAAMAGYTSVLFKDIHDGGPPADEYVFFDSSQIKSADTITYDDDGNIIPPSERFSENEDVRWSKMRSNGLTAEEQKALEKRVKEAERNAAREQKRSEEYKAEMKVTPKFTPDATAIAELANELAHTFSTEDVDVPGLEQKLKEMFTLTNEAASSGKEKFTTQALDLATEIATDIVDNTLADFVNVSANGKALRSELISMQANAVMDRILQTKMAKSTKADKWNAKVREAKAKLEATEKELGKTATYAIREAKKVERLEQEFNAYKQKMADKVAYLKAKTDAEIAFNNQYYRERVQKLREQYKAKYNRDMFAQREHYRGKIANIRGQQKAEKSLKRLIKSVNTLREMLSPKNAKNLQYVPDLDNGALKAAVADYLSTVDFVTKTMARTGVQMKSDGRESSRLDAIRKIAEAAKNKQSTQDAYYVDLPDYAVEYIDSLKEWITSLLSALETARSEGWLPDQFHARVANSDMLDLFNTLTVNITHAIQNINRTYVNARFAHVGDMALSTYNYLKDMKRTKGLSSNLSWSLMTPYYAFQRFGEGGKAVFEGLADGFDRFGMLSTQIKNKLLKTKDNPNGLVTESQRIEWGKEVKTINGTDAHGEKITLELTAAQLMSLYCLSRRDAALDHLYIGGITLRDQKSGRKEITNESPVHVTVEQVHEAVGKLSPEQIHVAQELQKFMSNECAAWGNEVTMERWGVNLLNEQFYFPMTTYDAERGTVSATDDQSANLYALDNSGFMKPLQKNASNALVLDNIFKAFGDHAANMAKYSALVLPMLDAMRWYNWSTRIEATTSDGSETETPVGVMPEIRKVFGDDATKYFRKLMSDLNNAQMEGGVNYGVYEKFLGNYKAASVAANLRVAALQPTAIARAAMVISPSYIVKGAAMKGGLAEMTKYSGIWAWKNFGMYGTDVGRSLRRQLAGETTKLKAAKNSVVEWSLKAAEFGDQIAWAALWNACRLEQQAQHPGVEYEALMELTRRRFNEVIFSTQVFDSTLSRADIMRKQDTGYKMATAFMAEPLLSANMVTNAFVQYSMDAQKMGNGEAWKKHGNKITRSLAVYTVTNLAAAIAESIMDAYRDDDDDPWIEKFLEHLVGDWSEVDDVQSFLKAMYGGNLVQDMSVIGKIPMLKDLVSFMQGYDIGTRMDMQGISNLLNVLAIWNEKINLATGKLDKATRVTWWGNMTLYGAIYKSLQAASQVTGVPAYNALRDIMPIYNKTIGAITGYVLDTYETAKDRAVKGLKEKNGMTDAEADIAKSSELSVDQITNYYTKTYEKLGTTPKAAGIPFDVYESYVTGKKEAGASNRESILAVIDGLGVSVDTKDKLYYMAGFAESKIDEAPWH